MLIRVVAGPGGPGRCAFCHDAAPPRGAPAADCPGCGVRLHLECHGLLSRCPTPGCALQPRAFHGITVRAVRERWDVIGEIGRERYGTSFHAFDRHLGRDVTLLYLDLRLSEAEVEQVFHRVRRAAYPFERSVAFLGAGFDATGHRAFLVREFVPGGESLARVLERRGTLARAETLGLGRALLGPLAALHKMSLLYGEVPGGESLLLERDGGTPEPRSDHPGSTSPERVEARGGGGVRSSPRSHRVKLRLANHGLGPVLGDPELAARDASGWQALLTTVSPYLAPEALGGEGDDARSEVYSLGVLLFRCLAGRLPWAGRAARSVRHMITGGGAVDPEAAAALDPDLRAVLLRALELDRSRRFRSAGEMLEALPAR